MVFELFVWFLFVILNEFCLENPDEIIVYTGWTKTYALEQRMGLIKELFLDIRYRLEIAYQGLRISIPVEGLMVRV